MRITNSHQAAPGAGRFRRCMAKKALCHQAKSSLSPWSAAGPTMQHENSGPPLPPREAQAGRGSPATKAHRRGSQRSGTWQDSPAQSTRDTRPRPQSPAAHKPNNPNTLRSSGKAWRSMALSHMGRNVARPVPAASNRATQRPQAPHLASTSRLDPGTRQHPGPVPPECRSSRSPCPIYLFPSF